MVNKTKIGAQYVINLINDVDYYDIILPLNFYIRYNLHLEKKKIIIFNSENLENRFDFNDFTNKINTEEKVIFNYGDIKYQILTFEEDVLFYSTNIKFNKSLNYSKKDIENYKLRLAEIKKIEYPIKLFDEYYKIIDILKIYNIINNISYYEKIKKFENQLTTIPLNNTENNIINKIIYSPFLKNNIESFGFELVKKISI